MKEIEWEKYRDQAGVINLLLIYSDLYGYADEPVKDFFKTLETLRPVRSRQVASLALAMARSLSDE